MSTSEFIRLMKDMGVCEDSICKMESFMNEKVELSPSEEILYLREENVRLRNHIATREQLIAQLEALTDDRDRILIDRVPLDDGTGRVLVMTPPLRIDVEVTKYFGLTACIKYGIFHYKSEAKSREGLIRNCHEFIRDFWKNPGEPKTHKIFKRKVLNAMRLESPAVPEALEGNADE